jgi:hypothetical protein
VSTKRNQAHERAVAKNEQEARTYQSAAAERQAELEAIRERTERLKALRLAQEARIQQHVRRASKATGKRAKGPEKKQTLADWIARQRASGRET